MTQKGAVEIHTPHTPGPTSGGPPSSGGMPRLEKYELIEEIGHGGMATVYRAKDPRLSRDVAVKVIHKHLRENTEVATRFVAEARAAAKLRHPGIVEVYDVSNEDDSERYLVVELLRGTTLRKILVQNREMPAEVGAAISLEICEALEHAHEAGIIHRDIKPENVLVELPADRAVLSGRGAAAGGPSVPRPASSKRAANDDEDVATARTSGPGADSDRPPSGPVSPPSDPPRSGDAGKEKRAAKAGDTAVIIKITDFGIAKILDAQGVTSTGQVLGSPAHMAPEQIEGGEVDARTDVFALGVLMYECLVGHLPFEGKNPAQVLRKVLDGIYVPADRERATVGGRWGKILASALARDAAERTRSPGAVADQIRAELGAMGITDPKAEIAAYFADPDGYTKALTARIVPRIVSRGEAARRGGDVPGAAADFNRALALAPSDLGILKRLTSLTSSASRRILLKRIGMIAAGTAIVGLVTFQVTRWVRARPVADETAGTSVAAQPPTAPTFDPPSPIGPAPDATKAATARVKIPMSIFTAGPGPSGSASGPALPVGKPRDVVISIIPGGATLQLDGQDVSWSGKTFQLNPGPHSVKVSSSSKCCKSPKTDTINIVAAPAERPDEPQTVVLVLETNPASVSLVGAPADGQVACSGIVNVGAGGTQTGVRLKRAEQGVSCVFTAPGETQKTKNVTLKAGEANSIPWPRQ